MFIKKIKVQNFRLLKDFSIDLQPELSLVVGKNNVGKTSLLVVLDKCLNSSNDSHKKFQYYDFNLDFQKSLETLLDQSIVEEKEWVDLGIRLRLIVEFNEFDSLDNVGNRILTNLEENNNYFALGFDYCLDYSNYLQMISEYQEAKSHYDKKHPSSHSVPPFDKHEFLDTYQHKYFKIIRKSIHVNRDMSLDEERYIKLDGLAGFKIDDVIRFDYISARRSVDNREADHTLSNHTSELYRIQEDSEENTAAREDFIASLKETDSSLTEIYGSIFEEIIGKISKLGGMHAKDSVIKIISTLHHRELLKGNTTVVYEHDKRNLPEHYNGLGYMNLISMIFEISLIVERMKRAKSRRPADINLLFIEEPEAHTHPQMQYVFIKNIKALLQDGIVRKDGTKAPLQYIVSTHSSHIVSDSDFEDIKYITRISDQNAVESKNLNDLKALYIKTDKDGKALEDDKAAYRFLKQYLTLMNSELLFADKAIFIEGDTERILLPIMMQKVDEKNQPDIENRELGLLSQNISVLPIGAHSHIFEKFFHFIGVKKLLILTDIDICEAEGHHKKCPYKEGGNFVTSNTALKHYFERPDINYYISLNAENKRLKWNEENNKMEPNTCGNVMVCYQTKEGDYQPRSFEDDFFHLNEEFMCNIKLDDVAIDPDALSVFKEDKDPYKLAEGVVSKAALAASLILLERDDSKWSVPRYIEEGLLWIRN